MLDKCPRRKKKQMVMTDTLTGMPVFVESGQEGRRQRVKIGKRGKAAPPPEGRQALMDAANELRKMNAAQKRKRKDQPQPKKQAEVTGGRVRGRVRVRKDGSEVIEWVKGSRR